MIKDQIIKTPIMHHIKFQQIISQINSIQITVNIKVIQMRINWINFKRLQDRIEK
ncbi:hypothetical protein LCGC14_1339010 [marine sediment metagenome]|uniref:Uncharacterized protein n=1 Tax=marine sediment metagenome TaxID=412755 RepID=A0A0F9KEY7_9ZZZZ